MRLRLPVRGVGYGSAVVLLAGTFCTALLPPAPAGATNAPATIAVAAGGFQTCALSAAGTVSCWGDNGSGPNGPGELGDGTETKSSTPVPVLTSANVPLTGAKAITTGSGQSCALLTNGTADCWGDNEFGQLGDLTHTGPEICSFGRACSTLATPVLIAPGVPLANVIAISTGDLRTCALLLNGTVDCWGANFSGALGAGKTSGLQTCASGSSCSAVPVQVLTAPNGPALTNVTAIATGGTGTCALLANQTVDCWGDNYFGTLGVGSLTGPELCGGFDPCSTVAVPLTTLSGVTAITVGQQSACALLTGGSVKCWGSDSYGELANPGQPCGLNTCSPAPVPVLGLPGAATAISTHFLSACALLQDKTVECWGASGRGQLGNGDPNGPDSCAFSAPCSKTPVAVTTATGPLTNVTAITTGYGHACALLGSGALDCWGSNSDGQLGNGDPTGPDLCPSSTPCSTRAIAALGLTGLVPTSLVVLPASLPVNPGPVSYHVAVTGSGPTPGGVVTVSDGKGGSCVASLIAGSGSCSIANESSAASPYTITATYSGDTTYASTLTSIAVVGAGSAATGTYSTPTSGGVTVTATNGTGTVTETAYPFDPGLPPNFNSSNIYFDVQLSNPNSFTSVKIEYCDPGVSPTTTVEWADSLGNWHAIGSTAFSQPPNCVTVTIDNMSTNPSLADLTGTVFAIAKPFAKPGAPRSVSAVPGNGRATAHWTKPLSNGGKSITGYKVTAYLNGAAKSVQNFGPGATGGTMTGLTNGKTYALKVAAKNVLGTGPSASASVVVGTPTAPTGIRAARVTTGLRVAFTASANNGSTISGYTVKCSSSNGGATRTKTGPSSPITVVGPTLHRTYRCTVNATNARGTGPTSSPSLAVST
jgi:alpha-tubulin suppressor-like RCC1 family protein